MMAFGDALPESDMEIRERQRCRAEALSFSFVELSIHSIPQAEIVLAALEAAAANADPQKSIPSGE